MHEKRQAEACLIFICCLRLLVEISLEKACETCAVASLVLCHLVNGIVDSVIAKLLSPLCKLELAFASALLCRCAELKVLLRGVGNNFAEKLCKLGCMVSLFISIRL